MLAQIKPHKGLSNKDLSEHLGTLNDMPAVAVNKMRKALALPITLAEAAGHWYSELSINIKGRYSQLRQSLVKKYIDLQ